MDKNFINKLYSIHQSAERLPNRTAICNFSDGLLQLLFPQLSEKHFGNFLEMEIYYKSLYNELTGIFAGLQTRLSNSPEEMSTEFLDQLPTIHDFLLKDANAIAEGDPAAQNVNQVIRTYPGFYAIAMYRIAHAFCTLGIPLLPRVLTEYAHAKTGIDIHPKAEIGPHFCIDHGTGVVIGETSKVGKFVKVYQGVTLGALSVAKDMAKLKRHPTIEDHVVIYSGATILGGNTVIGSHSVIGGNVWITESIPPYSRVYHRPQIEVRKKEEPPNLINFNI